MIERTYRIVGVVPQYQHNGRLADPLDKWTKLVAEISKKRKKTEADLIEMGRREWYGSLYTNSKGQIVWPGANLERMIRDAAAKSKMGKAVQAGVICPEFEGFRLEFPDMKKSVDTLWEMGKYSKRDTAGLQGRSKVIRTRFYCTEWSLEFRVQYDEELVSTESLDGFIELAGRIVGLGDWRPKHGRFTVESAA